MTQVGTRVYRQRSQYETIFSFLKALVQSCECINDNDNYKVFTVRGNP